MVADAPPPPGAVPAAAAAAGVRASLCDWQMRLVHPDYSPPFGFDLASMVVGFFLGAVAGAVALYAVASLELKLVRATTTTKQQLREYTLSTGVLLETPLPSGRDSVGEAVSQLPLWAQPEANPHALPSTAVLPPPRASTRTGLLGDYLPLDSGLGVIDMK